LSVTSKIWILQENGFKELTLVLFESLFLGLHILLYNIFSQTIYWRLGAQQSHEQAPKNVQVTLKDESFVSKFKVLFVCLPEDV
jgi:hypothetical protein